MLFVINLNFSNSETTTMSLKTYYFSNRYQSEKIFQKIYGGRDPTNTRIQQYQQLIGMFIKF